MSTTNDILPYAPALVYERTAGPGLRTGPLVRSGPESPDRTFNSRTGPTKPRRRAALHYFCFEYYHVPRNQLPETPLSIFVLF